MERRDVRWAEGMVQEVESLSAGQWRRFQAHGKYARFMDLYLTAKCLTDFYWHLRFGVYFNAWKHYDPGLHQDVSRWLQRWSKEEHGVMLPISRKALVMSRELCKTQILIAYDGWQFARDPNIRLLIRSFNFPLASQISGALMKMLVSKKFQRRYPWITPAVRSGSTQWERWTPGEFMLARDEEDVRVPSCQAMGVDGEPTGGHFHQGHYDDFEVQTNANSDIEREAMFSTFNNDDNLFMAGSQRIVAGTPWNPKALIDGILNYRNGMEGHDIDVYKQPCTNQVFDSPFVADSPVLLEDRCTLRCPGAGYPTAMEDLTTCAVTVTFFNREAGDLLEETREVVWNDGEHLRVNRPFGHVLGQPTKAVVGVEKPACPIRQTLDGVDWVPELKAELPPVVARHALAPGVGTLNSRFSLPKKRRTQGSLIFNAQQRLMSTDEEALVLNSSDLQVVSWSQVPEGERRWRRASDFASAKATRAATSMSTGFELPGAFYLTHICYVEQMSTTWKLLELVMGVKRVARLKGRLEKTTFENSGHIEEVIHDLLPDVCRDPYGYFMRMSPDARPSKELPTYHELAQEWFEPGEYVNVPIKWLGRPLSKNDRIAKQQPVWQSRKLFILEDCPHRETLCAMADRFTLAGDESYDLLDNLADLLNEGRLLKQDEKAVKVAAPSGENIYDKMMREARMIEMAASGMGVSPGWPA